MKLTPLPITAVPSPLHSPMPPILQTNMRSLPLSRLPLSLPAWSANSTLVRTLFLALSLQQRHGWCSPVRRALGAITRTVRSVSLRFVRLWQRFVSFGSSTYVYKTGRQMAKPVSRPTELHAQATTSNVSCSYRENSIKIKERNN